MPLEDDLDALHACPLGEFVERRKALAQALRKAGKKDDAAKIAAASKPTPAAWAVNQLARHHPEEIADLMAIGERLRAVVRSAFTGHGDASAMSEVQSAQRAAVARLTHLAARLLEAAGGSSSEATLERVAATLTTISTTGAWGGGPVAQLARDLDPPSLDVLAALVEDVAEGATAGAGRDKGAALQTGRAEGGESRDDRIQQETDGAEQRRTQEESARRAAAEARERIERAEAALRAASAIEEQRRAEVERARATVGAATSHREERETLARGARHLSTELEQAAEEARRKADVAALAARNAEDEASKAGKEEEAAKADLAAAEKALAQAAGQSVAAEEALVRERREQGRSSL